MSKNAPGHAGFCELLKAAADSDGVLTVSTELATKVKQEHIHDELICRQLIYAVGEMLDRAFMDPRQQEAWQSFKGRYS